MSLGPWQIAIIVVLLLLIFGPKRLPGLGQSIGEAIRNFRKGLENKEISDKSDKSDSSDKS